MKKFLALFLVFVFGFGSFALAGQITVKGIVVESDVEGKHYELKITDPGNISNPASFYVLFGKQNFQDYLGKEVLVTGSFFKGVSIYLRPGITVEEIKPAMETQTRNFKENLPYYLGLILVAGLFGYYLFLKLKQSKAF